MSGGIYKIYNTVTERVYIGRAKDFEKRRRAHLYSLETGKHKNKLMQEDFNRLGKSTFIFTVLEIIEDERTSVKREAFLISQLFDRKEDTYNIIPGYGDAATSVKRQSKRRSKLKEVARSLGYTSWSCFETDVINGRIKISKR